MTFTCVHMLFSVCYIMKGFIINQLQRTKTPCIQPDTTMLQLVTC